MAARTPIALTGALSNDAQQSNVKRVYQPDWAGPVLFAPHQKPLRIPAHRFCAVEGEWTVPYAKPTINCSNPSRADRRFVAMDRNRRMERNVHRALQR